MTLYNNYDPIEIISPILIINITTDDAGGRTYVLTHI